MTGKGLFSANQSHTMFKHSLIVFFSATLLFSCENEPGTTSERVTEPAVPQLNVEESNLKDWLDFYRRKGTDIDLKDFGPEDTTQVERLQGTVKGSFDPEFDSVYVPFLIYSPDKTKYVDIDSYQWSVGDDGEPAFDVDQEIDLVDLKAKTVRRIAFRGPAYAVENVSWKNNSVFYLLERSDDGQLFISEVDLKTGKMIIYRYKHTLSSISRPSYSKDRLDKNLSHRAIQ